MKQIIHHEQCKRCGECCRFREDRQDFAPIFTVEELDSIQQTRETLPEFLPFKGTDNIFQIQLKKAEKPTPFYPYVCPFLDEEAYSCTIYDVRPFDCRVWPFIVLRVKETGQVLLAHFTGSACLALAEVQPKDFNAYDAYMGQMVTSEEFLAFLRKYPQLIWDHESQGNYITVPSKDITNLLYPAED
jgi:Fe-S-cluster containining protein